MGRLRECPYCSGAHRKRSAFVKCAKKHDKNYNTWPKLKLKSRR